MTEAKASTNLIAKATWGVLPPFLSATWMLPAGAGALAGLLLVGLYLGLVSWAQGLSHARELLWGDRYFVAAIAAGFAAQVGLFVYVRRLLSLRGGGGAAANLLPPTSVISCPTDKPGISKHTSAFAGLI